MNADWLLGWWNLVFIVPFLLALIYLGVYTVSGITFGEGDAQFGGHDADADADHDVGMDADHDVDVDHDVAVEHDVGADHDVDADADADADADGDTEAAGHDHG